MTILDLSKGWVRAHGETSDLRSQWWAGRLFKSPYRFLITSHLVIYTLEEILYHLKACLLIASGENVLRCEIGQFWKSLFNIFVHVIEFFLYFSGAHNLRKFLIRRYEVPNFTTLHLAQQGVKLTNNLAEVFFNTYYWCSQL